MWDMWRDEFIFHYPICDVNVMDIGYTGYIERGKFVVSITC